MKIENSKTVALLGAAGYIAPRHLAAIRELGWRLVAAHDPHDSVGVLDGYFPEAAFFTEIERFDRHLDKLRRDGRGIDYLVVCSPNYLHDAHCRLGLRLGADVICEKPVALNPWNLDALQALEAETGHRIWCILQSRLHPSYQRLQVLAEAAAVQHGPQSTTAQLRQGIPPQGRDDGSAAARITINYITPRGPWYRYSWKGDVERSGGVVTNIGIHLFDAVLSTYGTPTGFSVSEMAIDRAVGRLTLANATVDWTLSVRRSDLPAGHTGPLRQFTVDGEDIDFSSGFETLHTESYRAIARGEGYGLGDARASVELVSKLRT